MGGLELVLAGTAQNMKVIHAQMHATQTLSVHTHLCDGLGTDL